MAEKGCRSAARRPAITTRRRTHAYLPLKMTPKPRCPSDNKVLRLVKGRRPKLYCSKKCRQKAYRDRKKVINGQEISVLVPVP